MHINSRQGAVINQNFSFSLNASVLYSLVLIHRTSALALGTPSRRGKPTPADKGFNPP